VRLLQLAGDAPDAARAAMERVMRLETALARATLDRVARRDPHPGRSSLDPWTRRK